MRRAKHDQIVLLAARFALPSMFARSVDMRAGGLFSYTFEGHDVMRQVAAYTGRILKGEKPADLPVVQATKFEFIINLRTAKALGFQIPADVLVATARHGMTDPDVRARSTRKGARGDRSRPCAAWSCA
jgi:putative ABC transport system substrate-binding protein